MRSAGHRVRIASGRNYLEGAEVADRRRTLGIQTSATVFGLALGAVLALAGPGAAFGAGTSYFARHGASGNCLTEATPCSLPTAVGDAGSSDRVVLEPDGGTFQITHRLDVVSGVDLGGETGKPTPTIHATTGSGTTAIGASLNSTLHDFRLEITSASNGIEGSAGTGTTIERVYVAGAATSACSIGDAGVLRDSVCASSLASGRGATILNVSAPTMTATIRNATLIGGSNSVGLETGADAGVLTIDAANVVARGGSSDVSTQLGTAGTTTVDLANSNYAIAPHTPGGSITPPGTNGNQTAAPLFANPVPADGYGDFHELSGSPTIDAGLTTLGIGSLDLDRKPRIAPTCLGGPPGTPDIGAYEYTAPPACPLAPVPPAPSPKKCKKHHKHKHKHAKCGKKKRKKKR
jgi:hypothetical protein